MALLANNDVLSFASWGLFLNSGLFPAENQVQTAVTYGPDDVYTGTYGGGAGSPPTAPTLSLVLSDNDVTATIDGDADVTNYLYYLTTSDTAWQEAGNRAGDGDITHSDIEYDVPYIYIVKSVDGSDLVNYSLAYNITATETADTTYETDLEGHADEYIEEFEYQTINYKPRGGGTRAINALVDYMEQADLDLGAGNTPMYYVLVENDSTNGISLSELDRGGDKLEFTDKITGSSVQRRIIKVMQASVGNLELIVQ